MNTGGKCESFGLKGCHEIKKQYKIKKRFQMKNLDNCFGNCLNCSKHILNERNQQESEFPV